MPHWQAVDQRQANPTLLQSRTSQQEQEQEQEDQHVA
jgi:hypothetical protein